MNLAKYNQDQIDEALSMKIRFEFLWKYGRFPRSHREQLMFFSDEHAEEFSKEYKHKQENETTTT